MAADNYTSDEVWIEEARLSDGGKVKIKFSTKPETLYFCPGATGEIKKERIEITFVRAGIKQRPKVTYPAQRVDDPHKVSKVIVVDSGGKPIFLKSAHKRVQVFPPMPWRKFSSATLRQLRDQNKPVLVFCGADWDLMAEFVELTLFAKESVADAIREQAYVPLRADFTKPSAEIIAFMRKIGARGGEVAVVVFRPDQVEPVVLQQVNTLEKDLLDAMSPTQER